MMSDQWSVAPFQPCCHRAQYRGVARTRDERPSASFDFSEHFRQRIDRRIAEPRIRISLACAGKDSFGLVRRSQVEDGALHDGALKRSVRPTRDAWARATMGASSRKM